MPVMSGNPDFDTYRLSEDHEAIREAVRAVAQDKIAPWAAAVDELVGEHYASVIGVRTRRVA